jgi:hypothetical protein
MFNYGAVDETGLVINTVVALCIEDAELVYGKGNVFELPDDLMVTIGDYFDIKTMTKIEPVVEEPTKPVK